jgi:small-conductance mechanosensitive channel
VAYATEEILRVLLVASAGTVALAMPISIAIAALFSTASAINATLFGAANCCYMIARDGELPAGLSRTEWKQATEGLLLTAGLVVVVTLAFDLSGIAMMGSAAFLLIYAAVNAGHLRVLTQTGASAVIVWLSLITCLAMFAILAVYTWQQQPAALIALVFALGEIWRRTTFRYVHDVRRRYQFLLLRRVTMWTAVVLIVVLAFATQLGSAVTFAGLLTAGVAVALQSVIVSVVGYFFLIGKYGLRVGDRVQISGVTGEVVEIGLVRIHLMKLGGPSDSQPSGRVVAFSNSIVFQATAGVFKQIPGTDFVWHELKLTLAADTDYHAAKERITQAGDSALSKYKENIEGQRRQLERNLNSVSAAELQPKIRLHYAGSGIEVTVRFPVELAKAAEIDDHLMRELLAALGRDPKLKLLSAEMPAGQAR